MQQEDNKLPIEGRWKLVKSENLDEWLKAVGVNVLARKLADSLSVTEEWFGEDEWWGYRIITKLKTADVKFKIKQPFIEHTIDGRKCKSEFHIEGDKLILEQSSKCLSIISREIIDDQLICTFEVDGKVLSRRYFKRDQ